MHIPDSFARDIAHEFQGRLRIRWSGARQAFHIEQQVGRACLPPTRIRDIDDDAIRVRDGYDFVMEVRPGDRMPCTRCYRTVRVPCLRTGDATCECGARHKAAYFPLGEALLEHLRSIDPLKDGHLRTSKEVDAYNALIERSRMRSIANTVQAGALDDKYRLFNTPFSGYTGRERYQRSVLDN